jgi:hypothetical protein
MPVFNYSDYSNELRDIVCSSPILEAASVVEARCNAINAAAARMSQNDRISDISSCCEMDADSIRNTLESMAPNAVFGDLAVLADRHFGAGMTHADMLRKLSRDSLLRKLKEDRRREELEQIKILRSIKATIRYSVAVK